MKRQKNKKRSYSSYKEDSKSKYTEKKKRRRKLNRQIGLPDNTPLPMTKLYL